MAEGTFAVLPFDYVGPDWRKKNRFRRLFAEGLVAVCAVVVFPFTLLSLFFWGLGRLANPPRMAPR